MTGAIHEGEHPFHAPEGDRDPIRRLRGRLAAPVTIVTSGDDVDRSGLTVSSLLLAEGEPGSAHFLVGRTADVYDAIARTDRFVIHVLGEEHRGLSDVFAGRRPSPGGPFADIPVSQSVWGPILDEVADRAFCSRVSILELGYSNLVSASIDQVEVTDLEDPLVYFRGGYRTLS